MTRAERVRCTARCHPYAANALVALALLAVSFTINIRGRSMMPGAVRPASLALEAVVFAALVFRSTWPEAVLATATAGVFAAMLVSHGQSPAALVVLLAVYTVAMRGDRRTAVLVTLTVGPMLALGASWASGSWFNLQGLGVLAWVGMAAAVGDAVRSKKAYVAAVEERARRAERTREEEASRRVIEERLRIARELHDVVAHHIAVIHVQAGVVGHLMTEQPEAAQQALAHVRRSSRTVLDELGGLLDVLRQPDDDLTPTDPAPGLDGLPSLIDTFAACGLKVGWALTGTPRPLPAAVDLVAYRLIQEGLTNAHKHGTGSAVLGVVFEPGAVAIDIVNPSCPLPSSVGEPVGAGQPAQSGPAAQSGQTAQSGQSGQATLAVPMGQTALIVPIGQTGEGTTTRVPATVLDPAVVAAADRVQAQERVGGGHGLLGMRERARAVGGSVRTVAQSDGTWRLSARLPLQAAT